MTQLGFSCYTIPMSNTRELVKDPHPFKLIRHSLEPRVTIKALAEMALVEELAVIRTEQSLFQSPPESIVYVLATLSDVEQPLLLRQYSEWATRHRFLMGRALVIAGPVGVLGLSGSGFRTPIETYLKHAWPGSKLQTQARNLCVHQSTLLRYVAGKQAFMPGQLVKALSDAGLDHETIMELDRLGQGWYGKYS